MRCPFCSADETRVVDSRLSDDGDSVRRRRECEVCGNKKAWYWLQQTRSADEPPTQFFRCTKCKRVWREYK